MKQNMEVLATNNIQGVPPNGKSHQWEVTNHVEIVHMCVVCCQQTKTIWRTNGECLGYKDLFQDYKGAPLMTVERPDVRMIGPNDAVGKVSGKSANLVIIDEVVVKKKGKKK